MRFKDKKQHNKGVNLNKIKNTLDKFDNVFFRDVLSVDGIPKLIYFDYFNYTLALEIDNFNYETVLKKLETVK